MSRLEFELGSWVFVSQLNFPFKPGHIPTFMAKNYDGLNEILNAFSYTELCKVHSAKINNFIQALFEF